jgi:lipid-binding SYLF domain-containing protein
MLSAMTRQDLGRSRAHTALVLLVVAILPHSSRAQEAARIREAATVVTDIMSAPDRGIPRPILERAEAIVVFPSVLKGGFVFGGHRGRGIVSVRERGRGWSPPAFVTLTGGSFGLQIGGQAVDLVLVVMNRRGVERLLANQFKIGADTAVAAGPVGREAEASTDLQMRAEILSYSRARGLFAGVTIKGSVIKADADANARFYGRPLGVRDIVLHGRASPKPPVELWTSTLARYAG